MNTDRWEMISFIMSSGYRRNLLLKLSDNSPMTPSQIAKTLECNISHTSRLLKEMGMKGLIICLTPEKKRYKLFKISEKGLEYIEEIKRQGLIEG